MPAAVRASVLGCHTLDSGCARSGVNGPLMWGSSSLKLSSINWSYSAPSSARRFSLKVSATTADANLKKLVKPQAAVSRWGETRHSSATGDGVCGHTLQSSPCLAIRWELPAVRAGSSTGHADMPRQPNICFLHALPTQWPLANRLQSCA